MNDRLGLRYVNRIVGVFLFALFAFLFLLAIILFRGSDFLAKSDNYWILSDQDSSEGLYRGAEVIILGEPVGRVESLGYVAQSSKIRIDLSIDSEKSPQILTDSVVTVERKYALGTPILVIRRGDLDAGAVRLPPGSQITSFAGETDRVDEMAEEIRIVSDSVLGIKQSLVPTLQSMDAAAKQLQATLSKSADPAFAKSEQASDAFVQTNATLRPDLLETSASVRGATDDFKETMDTLADSFSKSTEDVGRASRSIETTSDRVRDEVLVKLVATIEGIKTLTEEFREIARVLRSESRDLPGTTARINDTVEEAQDLVGEVRSHWLLRRYTNLPSSTSQVSPSTIRGGSIK
jgi:ABC-type transporter Mla subunit MlaD